MNPLFCIDFYKVGHIDQYPEGTEEVYSNFTPRSAKLAPVLPDLYDNKLVVFGIKNLVEKYLTELWEEGFFKRPKEEVIEAYKHMVKESLGITKVRVDHIEKLHDFGNLPLTIKAIPEGSLVDIGIPILTIRNTLPEFYWLTNFVETAISSILWKPCTVATIARQYRLLLEKYCKETGGDMNFVDFQAHDFSSRGMSGLEDAAICGAAHLLFFKGTDSVSSIDLIRELYTTTSSFVGGSVPATEHSVMCMGGVKDEIGTFRRLITDIYPKGVISIVSDTWDFWRVVTDYLPVLKYVILNREGKVVIRPDSGDPFNIVVGDEDAIENSPERKGAIECLWDIFGGTINEKGYKQLNPKIGLIYGDSITLDRANRILKGLKEKGFASTNIVFGVGSYTYQYITRDSFGFAMKATSGVVEGRRSDIFKDPKTDSGVKKSAKGLIRVEKEDDRYVLHEQQTEEEESQGVLKKIFIENFNKCRTDVASDNNFEDIRRRALNVK